MTPFMRLCVLVVMFPLGGCASLRVVDDGNLDKTQLAHVVSDYRVRAGAPVNVYLRSVDGIALQFWQNSADIEPGLHRLLVDCTVPATERTSRHVLNVALEAGVSYRLEAEANERVGCTRVELIEQQ
jgi:hypothetical protein